MAVKIVQITVIEEVLAVLVAVLVVFVMSMAVEDPLLMVMAMEVVAIV